jgi:hypothetical protein
MQSEGEVWRHVYKSLLLLEYMCKHGPQKVRCASKWKRQLPQQLPNMVLLKTSRGGWVHDEYKNTWRCLHTRYQLKMWLETRRGLFAETRVRFTV